MNYARIKELVGSNSVFCAMDDSSGLINVPTGEFHDIEYGSSAFFPENGIPDIVNDLRTEAWDEVDLILCGQTDDHLAKAYLEGFYKVLLAEQNNCGILQLKSIGADSDLSHLFDGLSSQFTDSCCLVSSSSDFSRLLSVPFGSAVLRIQHSTGQKYHNRGFLSCGEPLILLAGPRKSRLIAAETSSVVLNLPQAIEPIEGSHFRFRATLQFKVIRNEGLKIFEIP